MNSKTFHDTKRDIYPTITLCIWNNWFKKQTGLYDREKLNKKYEIKDPLDYINFLQGYIWKEELAGVNYDDITLDIKGRIEAVKVISDTWELLYSWDTNDTATNESAKGQDSAYMDTQSFPFYTVFRYSRVLLNTADDARGQEYWSKMVTKRKQHCLISCYFDP